MQEDQLKTRKAARAAREPAQPPPSAQATTQETTRETTAKPAAPIEAGSAVLPRKAAAPVAPERVVAPPKALPTRVHRESPQPQPQPKAEPEKSAPKGWRAQWPRFRWLVALAALGSALAAQKMADDARVGLGGVGAPPTLSWVLFGLAAVLFVIGVPASLAPPTGLPTLFLSQLDALPKRRRMLFLGLLGAAVACDVAAVPLFVALNSAPDGVIPGWPVNTGSWLLYIVALFLFAAAWIVWERSTPPAVAAAVAPPSPPSESSTEPATERPTLASRYPLLARLRVSPSKVEWAVMGGLLLLALLLRLPGLDNAPPGLWFDEAENGMAGRNLLAPAALHPAFIGDFTQMGALYFYILGIVLKIFGSTIIWPLRLLPAIAGSLLAPMLYLIASRLYGWRVGVCAGALLAVSAWNITFSRFGMTSIPTVALDVGVYLCLLQGLRTGRLGYYAGAGVMMGLALQMYYASQLVAVVLLLVFLYRLATERMRFWRTVRGGIILLALGLIMGFLPVATFAAQHPDVYTARTGTVSIFTPEGSDNHPDALGISLSKHALMFNYSGDINGRHNIPGDPMLDWWTGAFFLSGLGVCLLRIWRWHYFFPFIWFIASMSGGVLTVVFEAPQAHRTLESSVITALIAGIFLGELWKVLTPGAKSETRNVALTGRQTSRFAFRFSWVGAAISVLALALLVVIGLTNVDRYFNRQMNNILVWQDMLGPDREIGRLAAQYGATHTVFVSAIKASYPPANYQAPGANIVEWPGMYTFPLTEARDTEVILTPPDGYDVSSIKRIYPNAVVSVLHGPNDSTPQLYSINIPATDIVGAHGVHAKLYSGDSAKAPIDLTLPTLDFDWSSRDAQAAQARTVRLTATLKVNSYGRYSFRVANGGATDKEGSALVDGFDVTAGTPITLGTGLHSVVVTDTVGSAAGATTNLLWNGGGGDPSQPINGNLLFDPRKVEPHGLTAVFRHGDVFDGAPADGRVDPTISFYFHLTPLQRPYTAEWTGKLYAPTSGSYTFYTEQISHSQLFIDGQVIITNSQNNTSLSASVNLTQGLHDIHIRFEDLEGFSHMYLYWTPPGMSDRFIIPSAFLLPAMGSYPAQLESGPWPSLEQADDTEWARSAEAQGSLGQRALPTQPPQFALPTPTTAEQQPTAVPPTEQAAVPSASPATAQTQAQAIQPLLALGSGETATAEKFERPKAGAVDDSGNIYLYTETDTGIRKFGPDGKLQTKWTIQSKDGTPATEISALIIKDGKLLALDAATAEIISYALDGTGGERTQLCTCFFPRGLAVAKDGNFWVADTGGSRVIKVDPAGQVVTTVGGKGSGPGQFVEPAGVWESPDGTLFVADVGNSRIQKFGPDLKPVTAWTMGYSIARDGNRVTGDKDGVLVTELDSKAVVRYNLDGKETGRWIYNGLDGPAVPAGISPAGNGKFLVLYPLDNLALIFNPGK